MNDLSGARAVQLHVIHDLGGGSARWLRDFGRADRRRANLVLRSFAHSPAAGSGLALYADAESEAPIRTWTFSEPIAATVASHREYRAALAEVIATHGVGGVVVSSVIGHALDVLDTGLPTVVVNHDYFPYSATINLHFDAAGRPDESDGRMPFAGYPEAERARVRERFLELARSRGLVMAVPSDSVAENLKRLDPRFAALDFRTIPHGYGEPLARVAFEVAPRGERLQLVVLGQLSKDKGYELLRAALPEITAFADVWLLGCREVGELFRYQPHVQLVSYYELAELPSHIAHIRPHAGLLLSVVPETFSYALSELLMLGVPPVATRLGSFAERIRHGEDGYLYEPDADALVRALRAIDRDREGLARVRERIAGWKPRSAAEMVDDYHRLLPVLPAVPAPAPPRDEAARARDAEVATVASMWKRIRSLDLQLNLVSEARQRTEALAAAQAESHRREAAHLKARVEVLSREIAERDAQSHYREVQLHEQATRIAAMTASTSWRLTAPLRGAGRLARVGVAASRIAWRALRQPRHALNRARDARLAWRMEGWPGLRRMLLDSGGAGGVNPWTDYRARFQAEVRPVLLARMATLPRRPTISVIVPTYNPNEDMLRQMLDSVRAQLYPFWELCIADDASTEPRVRQTLEEYAAHDKRIKLHLGADNRGVSHASNRALEMVTGDFVVLLDHDDILEEQALYRVAESILEDDPDLLYSDEALVTIDGGSVRRYALRPTFSLEYLRSHPYIVHLVGFRPALLRELGGWDEKLAISQDYDLILRAAERARAIVHVPEILYRWRIHSASAGIGKQERVMETSRGVLQRHLARCGLEGTVHDGPSFNLFDVRYPLRPGLKVAIVIPTKNHGDLLRQCIDSIRATVHEVDYDIYVVDHASDEPATLDYLASLAGTATVLPHQGPFNFSAINNRAIARLPAGYSHYLLCNNDIQALDAGWLERMLELGQHPDVAIVGPLLFYPDRRTIQHGGVGVGLFGAAEHYAKRVAFPDGRVEAGYGELLHINHEVAAVTAACLLVRADAFGEVGGFDEEIAVGFGDVDLCLRVGERGYRIVFCAHARLLHHESFTRGTSRVDPHPADSALFRTKWKAYLQAGDPYYSPGLSPTSTTWEVRKPIPCTPDVRRRVHRRAAP